MIKAETRIPRLLFKKIYEKRKKSVVNNKIRKITTGGIKIPPTEKLFKGLIKIIMGISAIKETIKKYKYGRYFLYVLITVLLYQKEYS